MATTILIAPYIPGIEKAGSLETFCRLMDSKEGGEGKAEIAEWADRYPYNPEVRFKAAWCDNGLGIIYSVRGMDLRAKAMEDNGRVWEDSCCEFFVSDPSDGTYYNFEMNCIGTLLASKRTSRTDCVHFTPEQLALVHRFHSISRSELEIAGGDYSWKVGMFIPFSLIGVSYPESSKRLRVNFYNCGDLTAHPHFLSWTHIQSANPDFHRPEFFGTLVLGDKSATKKGARIFPSVLFMIYLAALCFACFWDFGDMESINETFLGIPKDKIIHAFLFLPFPLLTAFATFKDKGYGQCKELIFTALILIAGLAAAVFTELVQAITDYRSCDMTDFTADTVGLAVGTAILAIIMLCRRK